MPDHLDLEKMSQDIMLNINSYLNPREKFSFLKVNKPINQALKSENNFNNFNKMDSRIAFSPEGSVYFISFGKLVELNFNTGENLVGITKIDLPQSRENATGFKLLMYAFPNNLILLSENDMFCRVGDIFKLFHLHLPFEQRHITQISTNSKSIFLLFSNGAVLCCNWEVDRVGGYTAPFGNYYNYLSSFQDRESYSKQLVIRRGEENIIIEKIKQESVIQIAADGEYCIFLTEDNKVHIMQYDIPRYKSYSPQKITNNSDSYVKVEIKILPNEQYGRIIKIMTTGGHALFLTDREEIYELNNIPQLLNDALPLFKQGINIITQQKLGNDGTNVIYRLDESISARKVDIPNNHQIIGAVASPIAPLFLTLEGFVYIRKPNKPLIRLRSKEKIIWVGKLKNSGKNFLISKTGAVYLHDDSLENFFCYPLSLLDSEKNIDFVWQSENHSKTCANCNKNFTLFNKSRNCFACGKLVCHDCSKNSILLSDYPNLRNPSTIFHSEYKKPVKVCTNCCNLLSSKKPQPFRVSYS